MECQTARYIDRMARRTIAPARKQVSLAQDVASEVEDFRLENRIPTESEAIRRLIELGLIAASEAKQ
jgi:hypothetical protein